MKKRLIIALSTLTLSAGCTLAPDYQRPDTLEVNTWQSSDSQPATTGWQTIFTDDNLRAVIAHGLAHNPDLRTALLNVERYRAQYRIQRAELLPEISANASELRQRQPDTGVTEQYQASADIMAYEVDLFGRLRSLNEQALQTYLAEEQNRRAAELTLVADIASAYLAWVADSQQLQLADESVAIESENLELVRRRHELGVASEQALAQADASHADSLVTQSRFRRLVELDLNALNLLAGAPLDPAWLQPPALDAIRIAPVEPGVPADLLNRRPDIIAAEHRLRAANANIGAARAAFFPRISLTASGGSQSAELDSLFESGTRTWLFQPGINVPIFSGGALKAQLDTAHVDRNIAVAGYEQAIQSAFTEVADALAGRHYLEEQLTRQEQALAAYQRFFTIADQRYRHGIDSMLNRLTAQQNRVRSEQATVDVRLAWLQAQIDLYRALGHGWAEPSDS